LTQSISHTSEIFLSYNQNDFSFQFASLDFNAPENIQYAYMLEGFDKNWINSGTRRFVTYTNLDAGEYVFKIKATNSDGVWNENGTRLAIIISPPFWATWWAYTIYFILLMCLLYFIRYTELKRRRKKEEERLRREREAALLREAKLKAIAIEQEKEIEKQKIRNRIARDLHDEIGSNLSSISLMSELIQKDGKINTEVFEKIKRIQKVAKGSSQAMRDIVWLTNPSSDNIRDLVSKMNEVANDMLGGLTWQFDFPKNILDINLVPEIKRNIFFIYKESLNNIVKHANAKNVLIELITTTDNISMIIKDDGRGFNQHSNYSGNGLKNLNSRANEINATIKIESVINNGTKIELNINITQVRD
jgi:signal transduction histidine kinase